MSATVSGPDGRPGCRWCAAAPEFFHYHDHEWGFPVVEDVRLFEKLCLESFQSGLSWRTILAKRENFRAAFVGFDFRKVAQFDERDVERLLSESGIVRHRGKIEAVINKPVPVKWSRSKVLWLPSCGGSNLSQTARRRRTIQALRPRKPYRRRCASVAGNS
jgi:hypothetical protein